MKIICFLIITVLLLTAAGCGKSGAGDTATTTTVPAAGTTAAVTTTPTTTAPSIGWVVADSMHVRSGPGTDYGSIGGCKYGETVVILQKEGDWYQIQRETGVGYVNAQFIVFEDPATMTTTTTAATITTAATTAAP